MRHSFRQAATLLLSAYCLLWLLIGERKSFADDVIPLLGHKGPTEAILCPSSRWIASRETGSNQVHLWAFPEGKKKHVLSGPKGLPLDLMVFSPDGKELTAAFGNILYHWKVEDPSNVKETQLEKRDGRHLSALAYSADGRLLAIAVGKTLMVLERSTNETKREYSVNEKGLSRVAFSNDSKSVFGASHGEWGVRKWLVQSESDATLVYRHKDHISGLVVDGDTLLSSSWDHTIVCLDVGTQETKFTLDAETSVSCFAYAKKKKSIIIGTYGEGIQVWDLESRKKSRQIQLGAFVSSVSISLDEKYVVVGYGNPFSGPKHEDNRGKLSIIKLMVKKSDSQK